MFFLKIYIIVEVQPLILIVLAIEYLFLLLLRYISLQKILVSILYIISLYSYIQSGLSKSWFFISSYMKKMKAEELVGDNSADKLLWLQVPWKWTQCQLLLYAS